MTLTWPPAPSATYRSPLAASNATPRGWTNVPPSTVMSPEPTRTFFTCALPVSPTYTFPAASTATPCGPLKPLPSVDAVYPVAAFSFFTALLLVSAT